MSDDKDKAKPAAVHHAGKPHLLGMLLPAAVAAAAAFGGAKIAGAHHATAASVSEAAPPAPKPPGPTLALEPFLVTIRDANRIHPMKVTLAIEFDPSAKEFHEDSLKGLTPRVRDAVLSYLRTLTYEQVIDASASDKMRSDVLERLHAGGITSAERVLITDFVVQ